MGTFYLARKGCSTRAIKKTMKYSLALLFLVSTGCETMRLVLDPYGQIGYQCKYSDLMIPTLEKIECIEKKVSENPHTHGISAQDLKRLEEKKQALLKTAKNES